jgi:hypothetical protein
MALHETSPFPYQLTEIQEFAEQVKDPSFRIQISTEGMHIYNRDGLHSAIDPFGDMDTHGGYMRFASIILCGYDGFLDHGFLNVVPVGLNVCKSTVCSLIFAAQPQSKAWS